MREGRGRAGPLMIAAGVMITGAASYRYEGWMFLAVFGPMVVLHHLWFHWGGRVLPFALSPGRGVAGGPTWTRHGLWLAGACALALLFPAAWMASSWRALGSPLAFFSAQTGMNTVAIDGSLLERALHYPRGMHAQMGSLWGLAGAGLLVALLWVRRRPSALFTSFLVLAYIGIMVLLCVAKGTGVSTERYVLSMIVLLFPLVALVFAPLVELAARREAPPAPRLAAAVGLLLVGFSTAGHCMQAAGMINRYKHWGYPNESFMMGSLLQQEFHEPQFLPGLAGGGRVIIWNPDMKLVNHLNHLALMVGKPHRVILHDIPEYPHQYSNEPGRTLIIFHDDPATTTTVADHDLRKIGQFGRATIFHEESALGRDSAVRILGK